MNFVVVVYQKIDCTNSPLWFAVLLRQRGRSPSVKFGYWVEVFDSSTKPWPSSTLAITYAFSSEVAGIEDAQRSAANRGASRVSGGGGASRARPEQPSISLRRAGSSGDD
ncbi:hypothetical protein HN51_050052 [Arachis hypogaea]